MKTLEVYLPYPKTLITQRFGENANGSYAADGLKGHTAYDWGASYGTDIPNCTADAYCYSLMHKDDPVLMDYRAAFFIVETDTGVYEVSYGHMSEILAVPGKTYQVGDVIGKVGNTGPVFSGQHEVTEAEKDAGSHAGAHLHGPQIRPVKKVKTTQTGPGYFNHYLSTGAGTLYQDKDGFYYEVPDYQNGYNGCVSLAPFSTETLATEYKAPSVETIIQSVAVATAEVASLPKEQQSPFIKRLLAILAVLGSFLQLK
jgi:murein DD-endopeptidase MepM/ murein hydrolase activator NlpD